MIKPAGAGICYLLPLVALNLFIASSVRRAQPMSSFRFQWILTTRFNHLLLIVSQRTMHQAQSVPAARSRKLIYQSLHLLRLHVSLVLEFLGYAWQFSHTSVRILDLVASTAGAESSSCVVGESDELSPGRPLAATSPAAEYMQNKRGAPAFKRKPGSIPDSDVSDSDVSSSTVISSHSSNSQQQQTGNDSNTSNDRTKISKSKTTYEFASNTLLARMKERHREECRRSWQSSEPFRPPTQLVRSISAMPGRIVDGHGITRTSSILAQQPYNPARQRKQRVSIEEPPMTRKADRSTSWPTDPSSSKRRASPSQLPPTPPPESPAVPNPGRSSFQHKMQYAPSINMALAPKTQETQERDKSPSPRTESQEDTSNCLQDILAGSKAHEKVRELCEQLNVLLSQSAVPLMIIPANTFADLCVNAQCPHPQQQYTQHSQQHHHHQHHCQQQRHQVTCCHHFCCCQDIKKKRQQTHIMCRHKIAAERTAGPCAADNQ